MERKCSTYSERAKEFLKMIEGEHRHADSVCNTIKELNGYPKHYVEKREIEKNNLAEAVYHAKALVKILERET